MLSKASWGAVGWQHTGHSSEMIAIPRLLRMLSKASWGAVRWQHTGHSSEMIYSKASPSGL